jgi:activator of HSP90 ATPase
MDSRLHQEVDFEVSASRIYAALLDEKQFTAFSGAPARIEPEAGGAFKLFYDHPPLKGASGRTLELVVNRLIVQAWRAEEWAPGDYSLVRFELKANGPGTLLVFDQVGLSTIPPARAWSVMYWDPLRKYLAS